MASGYEVFEEPQGAAQITSEPDGQSVISTTRVFNITSLKTTSVNVEQVRRELQSANQLPRPRTAHPFNAFMFCNDVQVTQESNIYFKATASYESDPFDDDDGGNQPLEPWNRRTVVKYRTRRSVEPIDVDWTGKPMQTAVREPFQGISRPFSDLTAVLTRPFLFFDPTTFYDFIDHTNADTFLNFPPGSGIVSLIEADPNTYGTVEFFDVMVEIQFRKPYGDTSVADTWKKRVFHEGFIFRDVLDDGKEKRAKDASGIYPTAQPVPLKINGDRAINQTEYNWKYFQVFGEIPFNSMGFDV